MTVPPSWKPIEARALRPRYLTRPAILDVDVALLCTLCIFCPPEYYGLAIPLLPADAVVHATTTGPDKRTLALILGSQGNPKENILIFENAGTPSVKLSDGPDTILYLLFCADY